MRTIASLVTAAALTAGCSASPSPSLSPVVTSSATLVTNSQDPKNLRDGGTLRVPILKFPTQWNPFVAAADADTRSVLDAVRPRVFDFAGDGTPTPDPDFVTSADATHDGKTVATLALNPEAVWGDGAPITAGDWVATWTFLTDPPAGVDVARPAGLTDVESVRQGENDHQVVITYSGVEPDWSQPWEYGPLRAASVANAEARAGWSTFHPEWFAGPFTITHIDRQQGLVTLERNARWWGTPPRLSTITFRTIQQQAEAAAFASNEFDIFDATGEPSALALAGQAEGVTVRSAEGRAGRELILQTADSPLADQNVRQAVLRALNRERLADAVSESDQTQATVWSNHLLLTNQPGYSDQAEGTGLGYDPQAAGTLLSDAGWTLQGGHRVRDGRPLQLTINASGGDERAASEAARITSDLAAIGITVEPTAGAADLSVKTVTASRYPLADLGARVTEPADLHELAARVQAEADPASRVDLANRTAAGLWRRADTIPLYQEPQIVAVKSELANLGADGFASVPWSDVGWSR